MRDFTAFLRIAATALLVPGVLQTVLAQQAPDDIDSEKESIVDYTAVHHFGGPASVGAQLKSDHERKATPYWFEGLSGNVKPYYDFKTKVNDKYGLAFGADYNALYQGASESLGEDDAAGGVIRFYGTWTLRGRGSKDTGALTFKIENRHRLGGGIAPQQLAEEVGYAGLTAITFSDAGSILTNLYWQQSFNDNSVAFAAGIVDVTDYVDVYGLVSPWTNFNNLAFSTDPTIPAPDQGLGAAVRGTFGGNYYVLAGLADTNGDPSDPGEAFDSFFDTAEYFKHVEAGWFSSWDNRFSDNVHLTAWQADAREAAQVPEGWGAALSFSRKFDNRWLPFLRLGYTDGGGGSLLERSLSAGFGYFRKDRSDVLGVGLNWGRPSEGTFGPGLDDQFTAELFYRVQLFQHMTITPDIQLLVDPALNPEEDTVWVFGLRARVSF